MITVLYGIWWVSNFYNSFRFNEIHVPNLEHYIVDDKPNVQIQINTKIT